MSDHISYFGDKSPVKLRNPGVLDPVVELYNILTPVEVEKLRILAECVNIYLPDHLMDRQVSLLLTILTFIVFFRKFVPFKDSYGGGNNVTFLSGFINDIFPDIVQRLRVAADAGAHVAKWSPYKYPLVNELGIRCVEYLTYQSGGLLGLHEDKESIYTLIVMLGDPADFTGGEFMIQKDKNDAEDLLSISPQHYGGFLFFSEFLHGINKISTGTRTVLAVEFWPYEDSDVNNQRPSKLPYEDPNEVNNVAVETLRDKED